MTCDSIPSTQTPSRPAAIAPPACTGMRETTSPVSGSMRDTLVSGLIAQTPPAPAASWLTPARRLSPASRPPAAGPPGSSVVVRGAIETGSSRETLCVNTLPSVSRDSAPFPTQTAPSPTAMSVGTPTGPERPHSLRLGVDPRDRPVVRVQHPDGSLPDGNRARGRAGRCVRDGAVPVDRSDRVAHGRGPVRTAREGEKRHAQRRSEHDSSRRRETKLASLHHRTGNRRDRRQLDLGDDLERTNPCVEAFQTQAFALHEADAFQPSGQARHRVARQDLAGRRNAAEPGGEVERAAAIAALHRDCFAGCQTDADPEREHGPAVDPFPEPRLQLDGRPQRLPRGSERAESLVATQLDQLAAQSLDDLPREDREARCELAPLLVAVRLREARVPADVCDQERADDLGAFRRRIAVLGPLVVRRQGKSLRCRPRSS